MPKKTKQLKNAFYAQSGGVTAVINSSAAGVIETARKNKKKIGKVYAGRNGIIGALTEELITATGRNYYLTVAQELRKPASPPADGTSSAERP